MVDLRNGRIIIGNKQGLFDYIYDFFALALMVTVNFSYTTNTAMLAVYYCVLALFLLWVCIDIINRGIVYKKLTIPLSLIWYGLFFIYAVSTYFWSVSPDSVLYTAKQMLQPLLIGFGLSFYLNSTERIYKFMKYFMISVDVMCLYLVIKTPFSELLSVFSRNNEIVGVTCNFFGQLVFTCVAFTFYLAYVEGKKRYYILALVYSLLAILTASRKAFLMIPLAVILMMLIYRNKKSGILIFIGSLVAVVVICVAIFKIDALYNVVGYRIESMVIHYVYGTDVDHSLWLRELYIKKGFEYFSNHPILGNGLNSFGYLFEETGLFGRYSHNNFIELLSCLGMVGFCLYYWFYAYLFSKFVKYYLKKEKLIIFAITFLTLFTVFQYGIVAYYDKFTTYMVVCCFMIVSLYDRKYEKYAGGNNVRKIT